MGLEHPQLEAWGAEYPKFMHGAKSAPKFIRKFVGVFPKSNNRDAFQEILQTNTAYTVNLHNPVALSARSILPSINDIALRFIPSSYWTILYDAMLPRLKQRFCLHASLIYVADAA